jgi:hypothetical protein
MINNRRLSRSDGGHGDKDSGNVELHLDGLIGLVVFGFGIGWMEKEVELESGFLNKVICL